MEYKSIQNLSQCGDWEKIDAAQPFGKSCTGAEYGAYILNIYSTTMKNIVRHAENRTGMQRRVKIPPPPSTSPTSTPTPN